VRHGAISAEPCRHVPGRQCGQLTQGPNPEPGEQAGELGAVQHRNRLRCEKGDGPTRWHHHSSWTHSRREHRGERPVSHADRAVEPRGHHRVTDGVHGDLLTAVVARGPAGRDDDQPRPDDFNPRAQRLHHADDLLERPGLSVNVLLMDDQMRTSPLGIAELLPATHTGLPSSAGTSRHPPMSHHHRSGLGI
jgi:hypothetical protein